jgi:hypothetical protein
VDPQIPRIPKSPLIPHWFWVVLTIIIVFGLGLLVAYYVVMRAIFATG